MDIFKPADGNCRRIESHLDSYLSDELTVESQAEVSGHLEICEECKRSLGNRSRLKAQLKRAAMQEFAPSGLRERITDDLRRGRAFNFGRLSFSLAAAAAVLVITGVALINSRPTQTALSLQATVAAGDLTGQVLKIGFDDHVYCAIDHDLANKQFTRKQMAESLGPAYAGLVDIVEQRMLGAYAVVVGHRCHYQGREFIHLIMRNQKDVASLVVTRKNGESFASTGDEALAQTAKVPVYRRTWAHRQVSGLETRDHLVFVVSSETAAGDPQVEESLAPAVHDLLARLES